MGLAVMALQPRDREIGGSGLRGMLPDPAQFDDSGDKLDLVIAGALQEHCGAAAVCGDRAQRRRATHAAQMRHGPRQHASRSANPSAWRVS
jgi:hypothetical protein